MASGSGVAGELGDEGAEVEDGGEVARGDVPARGPPLVVESAVTGLRPPLSQSSPLLSSFPPSLVSLPRQCCRNTATVTALLFPSLARHTSLLHAAGIPSLLHSLTVSTCLCMSGQRGSTWSRQKLIVEAGESVRKKGTGGSTKQ